MQGQTTKLWLGYSRKFLNCTFEHWLRGFFSVWRLIVTGLCFAVLYTPSASAQKYQTLTYSIRSLHLQPGERVPGMQIHAQAAAFKTLASLPAGWSFNIDLDASWQTKLEGAIEVGSAALDVASLARMHFLVRTTSWNSNSTCPGLSRYPAT